MNQNTKMLVGAVIAAALAIAVYYGFIGQQTANNIQTHANQTLGTSPATQQQPGSPGATTATPAATGMTPAAPGTPPAPAAGTAAPQAGH